MKTTNTTHSSLIHLMPYDISAKKNGLIMTTLREYQALLRAFYDALQAMEQEELEKFDSLVGENACEVRAVWMAMNIAKCSKNMDSLKDQTTTAIKKIDLLLSPKKIASLMSGKDSLREILEKEELNIPLTSHEMFMIQSYLLSELKSVKESPSPLLLLEVAEPKKFMRFGDTSINFARNLLNRLRILLAENSIQFIREIAISSQDLSLMRMVSEKFTFEHNNLPCTPMFWTCKAVLLAAQENRIPLLIHVRFLQGHAEVGEDCLYFKCNPDNSYYLAEPNAYELDQPAWVIQGVATADKQGQLLTKEQWREAITKRSITDVILAGAADHRQYRDHSLDHLLSSPENSEYDDYKELAKTEGFSSENPTTFFIQHVYATRASKLLNTSLTGTRESASTRESRVEQKIASAQ